MGENGEQVQRVDSPEKSSDRPHRDERRRQGKSLRKNCPRSSHGNVILGQETRDPLALLEQSNADRLENLLPIRFTRMAESSFAFFRGSAVLQAHDLVNTPSAGITVQCCGDCHLMNFGGFASPERQLIFDINDFDETLSAPFEWDLKRLTTSFVLAARWLNFKESDAKRAAEAVASEYRKAQSKYAEMSVLETWYDKVSYDWLLEDNADDAVTTKIIKKDMIKATENTSEHVFHKITQVLGGQPRIVDQPPLLFHEPASDSLAQERIRTFFSEYRSSLPADKQALFDRYRIVDVAYKVVGVGSVGTRCYIALLTDWQDDHLFLQVKEARSSVLEGRAGPCNFDNNGERVVTGQRLMQSASDIFLGWSQGPKGRHFYVRQMRDMKLSPNIVSYTPRIHVAYARLCGYTLARAHAKVGDPSTIAGYLGNGDTFDQAISNYAVGYADQVEKDYESFQKAVRTGRFPVETLPSETEQAIR